MKKSELRQIMYIDYLDNKKRKTANLDTEYDKVAKILYLTISK